ncbi:MAG TPA: hypothetical protein VFM79_10790 [Pelobium sp.]|nr:hypothetical protein [Pelobium sp.]
MKNLKLFGLLLFISASIMGCSKETEIKNFTATEKQLLGNWVEKEPYNENGRYYGGDDGTCDTLVFTNNNKVELYFPLQGWGYKVIGQETILFTNEQTKEEKNFVYAIDENGELTIYNFVDRSITARVKNITFVRLNEFTK